MKLTQENRYLSGPADVLVATVYGDDPQSTMDAAHIAMCVNNHDDLVTRLERCNRLLATIQATSGPDAAKCIQSDRNEIMQTLAKVKP